LVAERPLPPSQKRRDCPWLQSFPDLLQAVDGLSGAKLTIETESNASFGMGAKVAKVLSINFNFLKEQRWRIAVQCG
jgi:hypothetical protein